MKLNIQSPKSQTNQDNSNVKKAKISDIKVIVDLLRRHYAFPIRTLVQEYLCNARDSHREINQTKPMEITLPTKSKPVFKIRDFGGGMDTKRLEENFLSYGGSTKNSDNNQTGGFGIGSKSAWVYTPTFYIKVFKNKKETLFEASIAEHYEGALKEISKKVTAEEQGVEIQIPIQIKDIKEFIHAFYRATYFWKEEVVVVNFTKEELNEKWLARNYLRTPKMLFIGEDSRSDFFSDLGMDDIDRTLVVDGIPYEIANSFYYGMRDLDGVVLSFETGELSVSISREAIEDVDANRKRIEKQCAHLDAARSMAVKLLEPRMIPAARLPVNEAVIHVLKQQENFKECFNNIGYVFFNPFENTLESYDEKKHKAFIRKKEVFIGVNLEKVKYSSFYKNRNNCFSLDRDNQHQGTNCKFLVNDSKENITKIEKVLRFQTGTPEFKGITYIVMIHNDSILEVKPLVSYLAPQKFSEVMSNWSQIVDSGNKKDKTVSAVTITPPVRTSYNCLKKGFKDSYSYALRKEINSGDMFHRPEYLILSWADEDFIKELKNTLSMLELDDEFPVYFVAPTDLSLFSGKKFFKRETMMNMKVIKEFQKDLSKLLSLKKEMVSNVNMIEILFNLKILTVAKNFNLHKFQESQTQLKRLAATYKVKPDKVFGSNLAKALNNKYSKYVLTYLENNYLNSKEITQARKDLGI